MAKIKIHKVVRPLDLGDYGEEYAGIRLHVWLNPPRSLRKQYDEIQAEINRLLGEMQKAGRRLILQDELAGAEPDRVAEIQVELAELPDLDQEQLEALNAQLEEQNQLFYAWWAHLWSQHKLDGDEYRWTGGEVRAFALDCLNGTDEAPADPGLWQFARVMSIGMMNDYLGGQQKKGRRP